MGFDMTDFNVFPVVDITDLSDQNATNSFTFPAIAGSGLTGMQSYYTQPNGLGTPYAPGDVVTASDFTSLPVTLYIYDDNGSCSDEESFLLDIITPQPLVVSLSSDTLNPCPEEITNLTATVNPVNAQGSYDYEWTVQGSTIIISTTNTATVSPAVTTTYECTVLDSGLTVNNSMTELITVTVSNAPQISPIGTQIVTGSFMFPVINGSNLSGSELYYTQPNGLGTSYVAGDVINLTEFNSYPVTLYIYDENAAGCEDEESFELIINPVIVIPEPDEPPFDIPDYVTPNSDGFNDFWAIEVNSDNIVVRSIYIFDRYGKLLKQLAPDGIGWDAMYNNNPLPSSTYWYLINYEENGSVRQLRGFFAVKR